MISPEERKEVAVVAKRKLVLNKEVLKSIDGPGSGAAEKIDACAQHTWTTSNFWWCTGGSDLTSVCEVC